jgi:hypothetical protein
MSVTADENVVEDASRLGVLHIGPPGGVSGYAFITRENHGYSQYAARSWSSLDVDYRTLIDGRDHLRRHRRGVPLVVDVTHVGRHFVQYLRQAGVEDCEPVITFEDEIREPLTFRNPDSELWHVSEREAVSTLHMLHQYGRINFGSHGVNPGQQKRFEELIERFGTSNTEEEQSLWPLAIACLIAERDRSVIAS